MAVFLDFGDSGNSAIAKGYLAPQPKILLSCYHWSTLIQGRAGTQMQLNQPSYPTNKKQPVAPGAHLLGSGLQA